VRFIGVCEHHEDWAIISRRREQLVSGKHREISVGPISTIRQLLADGGTLHLYPRWTALERTPKCRLVTTGGLSDAAANTARPATCSVLK
jgi:hypothetical protein